MEDAKFSGTSDAWWATTIPINAAPDPATGTYNPDDLPDWESLYGQAAEGTWTLTVRNTEANYSDDHFTLNYWRLEIGQEADAGPDGG